ncbi:ParB/RepB/Spo0J family partition protein [Tabrizicola sp. J26]|uniref:ParB/RepB/Spo0J family partition protein n=1 Tax=Alitabrizicola rongguiensis TaxID=2909234 RepID=UPI001F44B9A1|nr:ParB/RepB/Spo0J family partition protein [Tabrizicola rongguiensis]MCF1708206.1 ParB/RepB/Spo0J family partition protein [Tabrizicola rongguiensis]
MNDKRTERRGLGRGLSALMADVNLYAQSNATEARAQRPEQFVPIELLIPNPDQPRRTFGPEALEDLAASIRSKGVIQPLIVRPAGNGTYEIVAGERRWRAAQMAQLHELPVLVRDLSDSEVLEVAIIENIQRADLNAIEEAMAYRQLMDRFGHTQEKLAEALAKSRSHIANLLRLLNLPEEVQALVKDGKLSAGHARALVATPNPAELARTIISRGLSVRQAEELAQAAQQKAGVKRQRKDSPQAKDADTLALEGDLSANLKMAVRIEHEAGTGRGRLIVVYNNLDDLDLLCRALSQLPRDGSV